LGVRDWAKEVTMEKGIRSFRDLDIWQKGIILVKDVYKETQNFPKEEICGLTSQMRRAAISTPSNIAEGHIRQHRPEFKQFPSVALGSLAELETQIIISRELGYISAEISERLIGQITSLSKMIRSLIKKLTNPQSLTPNP
jgi:four helix bundle protein